MSLTIDSLIVTLGDATILSDIALSVAAGERFAIMGPSGAGKSTLLRAIAGLTPIASGSIAVAGRDVASVPAHKRSVGLMFQDYALFPHMSVLENVVYGLRMAGVPAKQRVRRGLELLDLVGLAEFGERRPESLSGGEQQRTALARTLAPAPSLVLLDEPLGSLDESLKFVLLAETRATLEAVGATSIYVTHDPAEAFAFCNRMAIMDKGALVRVGRPDEIWLDPQSEFVARSVGHMNLVPCGFVRRDAQGLCAIPSEGIVIRGDGRFGGIVEMVTFADGGYTCSVRVPEVDVLLAIRTHQPPSVGQHVSFEIDPETLIVVSADEV